MKKSGVELIAEERQRQIEFEGFTNEHDKQHVDDELAIAAACYAIPEKIRINELAKKSSIYSIPNLFPWGKEWWKPSPDERITELVKAGALIAADIDRIMNANITIPVVFEDSQKCDQSQECIEEDRSTFYHLMRIKAIQETAFNKEKGHLMSEVFLRRTGAINDHKGNYVINSQDIFAWFENLDYLRQYTDYDKM